MLLLKYHVVSSSSEQWTKLSQGSAQAMLYILLIILFLINSAV
jgi:hypothetical protein